LGYGCEDGRSTIPSGWSGKEGRVIRVNVYSEELRDRVERVHQSVDGIDYWGIRLFVGPDIIHREGDDDTAAVTFWTDGSNENEGLLRRQLQGALALLTANGRDG
jgi:hypothetical protein